ncbi:EMC3/TMCO1 family protein [Methanopyrus sp.]
MPVDWGALARHFYPLVDPFLRYFGPALGMLVAAAIVIFFIDVVYELVIGREELERIQSKVNEVKKYQRELEKAKMLGDLERVRELEERIRNHAQETFEIQSRVMMKNLKAMLITFPPIIVIIYTLEYRLAHWTLKLPFYVPLVGREIGPVGWYILCATVVSLPLKPLAELLVSRVRGGG